jgi:hypothetical protein
MFKKFSIIAHIASPESYGLYFEEITYSKSYTEAHIIWPMYSRRYVSSHPQQLIILITDIFCD